MRVPFEGFDAFTTLHSLIMLSQEPNGKYSVRRKCYALDFTSMALEGIDAFSVRYPPHSDIKVLDPDAKYSPFGEKTTLLTG